MFSPAARLTDLHACPMQTPAVVPIPHVGGPIVQQGAATVYIAGLPAARVGDICICVGPPAPIVTGSMTVLVEGSPAARVGDMTAHGGQIIPPCCPTVLIGDAGAGAGSPAIATMQAARASGAAFVRTDCATPSVTGLSPDSPFAFQGDETKRSWIEIELLDQKNRPVAHQRYRIVPPGDGAKPIEGFLDDKGFARVSGIDPGTCRITFPDLDASSWKPDRGDPGNRTKPEPPPVVAGKPSVRATSVIHEVVLRPPSVKAASVTHAVLVLPAATRPGVDAPTVQLRVVARPPSVQRASVRVVVVSGRGKFVGTLTAPSASTVSWDARSADVPGDAVNHDGEPVREGA